MWVERRMPRRSQSYSFNLAVRSPLLWQQGHGTEIQKLATTWTWNSAVWCRTTTCIWKEHSHIWMALYQPNNLCLAKAFFVCILCLADPAILSFLAEEIPTAHRQGLIWLCLIKFSDFNIKQSNDKPDCQGLFSTSRRKDKL